MTEASDTSRSSPTPARPATLASPYVSLSIQCDPLYRVGAETHSYAGISEQSVYTRAAKMLRFLTPPPHILDLWEERPAQVSKVDGSRNKIEVNATVSPRVCIPPINHSPFPTIRWFEATRVAQATAPQGGIPQIGSPSLSSQNKGVAPPAKLPPLIPSGPLIALEAFQSEFVFPPRTSCAEPESTSPAPAAEELETSPHPPSTLCAAPLPSRVFPSSVLIRAVAQLVLILLTSKSNSAANFGMHQYCGVPLGRQGDGIPCWHCNGSRGLPSPHSDALVFSTAPQVVAGHLASLSAVAGAPAKTREAKQVKRKDVDTVFAVSPLSELTLGTATGGGKRGRSEAEALHLACTTSVAGESEVTVGSSAIRFERLLTAASKPFTQSPIIQYGTLEGEAFHQWWLHRTRPCSDIATSTTTTTESPSSLTDVMFYESETEWLTRGIFAYLFTWRAALPVSSADITPVERQEHNKCHTVFLKTSAFLLLSFAVHHSWCICVHLEIEEALMASRDDVDNTTSAEVGTLAKVKHVTRLPPAVAAQRSTHYEWRSTLLFEVHKQQTTQQNLDRVRLSHTPSRKEIKRDDEAAAAGVEGTRHNELSADPAVWQMMVEVVNRDAQLQWCISGMGEGRFATVTNSECSGGGTSLEGCGSLKALLQTLRGSHSEQQEG